MAATADRLRHDIRRALRHVQDELERIEILAAALDAFCAPVPDYEPAFHHLPLRELDRFELREP